MPAVLLRFGGILEDELLRVSTTSHNELFAAAAERLDVPECLLRFLPEDGENFLGRRELSELIDCRGDGPRLIVTVDGPDEFRGETFEKTCEIFFELSSAKKAGWFHFHNKLTEEEAATFVKFVLRDVGHGEGARLKYLQDRCPVLWRKMLVEQFLRAMFLTESTVELEEVPNRHRRISGIQELLQNDLEQLEEAPRRALLFFCLEELEKVKRRCEAVRWDALQKDICLARLRRDHPEVSAIFLAWDQYHVPDLLAALLQNTAFEAPDWVAKDVKSMRMLAEVLSWLSGRRVLRLGTFRRGSTATLVETTYATALRLAERFLEQGAGAVGAVGVAAEHNDNEVEANGAKRRRVGDL